MSLVETGFRAGRSVPARRAITAVLGAVLAGAAPLSADGWKVQLQGVKALGRGYAGRALAEDATTVWFNAAGMTQLNARWTLTTGAPFIGFALDYSDARSLNVLGQPMTGPRASDGGSAALVPHFYLVRRFGDRWWAGLGSNAPYGLSDDYGEAWVGRYHATKSQLTVYNINLAAALKVNEVFSIGLGADVQRSSATLGNRLDFGSFGAAAGLPLPPQGADGSIELTASDWNLGLDLSAAWKMAPRARIAATYRTRVEHTLEGNAEFEVPDAAALFASSGAFAATAATIVLPMPAELSVSTAVDLLEKEKLILVGDITWTNWSRFQQLTVSFANPAQLPLTQDASYEDAWRGAVGLVYRANNTWTLRAGALYENVPVPDATRNPRLPESNNTGFTAGGTYRLGANWDLDFSWSHLIPHDSPIHLSDPSAGTLIGKVRWKTDAVAAGASVRF